MNEINFAQQKKIHSLRSTLRDLNPDCPAALSPAPLSPPDEPELPEIRALRLELNGNSFGFSSRNLAISLDQASGVEKASVVEKGPTNARIELLKTKLENTENGSEDSSEIHLSSHLNKFSFTKLAKKETNEPKREDKAAWQLSFLSCDYDVTERSDPYQILKNKEQAVKEIKLTRYPPRKPESLNG